MDIINDKECLTYINGLKRTQIIGEKLKKQEWNV
tara:strand:+ start:173 stop:274 length:102 start_codon:yes stop_codon:yes gene_type:complete